VRARAEARVSAASVAVLRMVLGAIVCWSMLRYLGRGWVASQLTDPAFHVTYPGLWWVRPLPGPWMHLVLLAVAAAAVALALGWHQRVAAAVALAGFLWVESVDAATYLNHYELVTLLLAWAAVLPLSGAWSLDRRAGRERGDGTVGAWVVWALRAQLAVVYLGAGLAKLELDWLVRAEPLRTWFAARGDLAVLGSLLSHPAAAHVASWAGAVFDLTIVVFLLWRRSRKFAYAAVVTFHAVTWWLFPSIGLFPLAMVALTPVFFEPDWPERFVGRARAGATRADRAERRRVPTSAWLVLLTIVAVQVVLPVRHWFVPGDVRWDDYHYRWSWRVMLNERAGIASFDLVDPETGAHERVLPEATLAPHLARYVASRPEALRQYAHFLADEAESRTGRRPHVYVTAWVSVNGSNRALVVDPTVDLAAAPSSLVPPPWVLDPPWSAP
jgi:hypothetical protein